jgi:hypothetical protein
MMSVFPYFTIDSRSSSRDTSTSAPLSAASARRKSSLGSATHGLNHSRRIQLGPSQQICDRSNIFCVKERPLDRPSGDVSEFLDGFRARYEPQPPRLEFIGDRAPPAPDEGTDQDRGVEDRSDGGVSWRT